VYDASDLSKFGSSIKLFEALQLGFQKSKKFTVMEVNDNENENKNENGENSDLKKENDVEKDLEIEREILI